VTISSLLLTLGAGIPAKFAKLLDCGRSLGFDEDVDYEAITARFNGLACRLGGSLLTGHHIQHDAVDSSDVPV
jgi:hypothetical protein